MQSDSESDLAAVDDGDEDVARVSDAAGKEDENADLDPAKVREQLLDFLDELSSAESLSGDDDEEDARRLKYHHLPWRSRCWRVSCLVWAGLEPSEWCKCV